MAIQIPIKALLSTKVSRLFGAKNTSQRWQTTTGMKERRTWKIWATKRKKKDKIIVGRFNWCQIAIVIVRDGQAPVWPNMRSSLYLVQLHLIAMYRGSHIKFSKCASTHPYRALQILGTTPCNDLEKNTHWTSHRIAPLNPERDDPKTPLMEWIMVSGENIDWFIPCIPNTLWKGGRGENVQQSVWISNAHGTGLSGTMKLWREKKRKEQDMGRDGDERPAPRLGVSLPSKSEPRL